MFNLQHGEDGREHHTFQSQTRGQLLRKQAFLSHRCVCVLLIPPSKQLTLPATSKEGSTDIPHHISWPLERHTGSIHLLNSGPPPPPPRRISLETLHSIGLKQSACTLSSSSPIHVRTQFYLKRNPSFRPAKTLSFSIQGSSFHVKDPPNFQKWITTIPL